MPDSPQGSGAASIKPTPSKTWREQVDEVTSKAHDCSSKSLECENACSVDSNSVGCIAFGVILGTGSGVVKDVPRARSILKPACDAGRKTACAALDAIEKNTEKAAVEEEVQRAKKNIPRLLAKCDKLKPKLVAILAQVRAAARRRDREELARLQEKTQATSEEIQDVTADLNADINTAADGDSHKWAKMAAEVKRRCVP